MRILFLLTQDLDSPGGSAFASDEIWRAVERVKETEGYVLDLEHPWIIGIYPGNGEQHPHVFVHGNIIRNGTERWVEVGSIQYERL